MNNTLLLVSQLGQLILTLGPLALKEALKIKALLEVNPDYEVAVKDSTGAAIAADDATMADINAWRQSVGLPTLT